MADENTNLYDMTSNVRLAHARLGALAQTTGVGGVNQRNYKNDMQKAQQAPQAAAMAPLQSFSQNMAKDGGMAGMGGAGKGEFAQVGQDAKSANQNIRQLGNRTFYNRGGQWIDSRLSKEQQSQAKRIKQFSDEYFWLARRHGRVMASIWCSTNQCC